MRVSLRARGSGDYREAQKAIEAAEGQFYDPSDEMKNSLPLEAISLFFNHDGEIDPYCQYLSCYEVIAYFEMKRRRTRNDLFGMFLQDNRISVSREVDTRLSKINRSYIHVRDRYLTLNSSAAANPQQTVAQIIDTLTTGKLAAVSTSGKRVPFLKSFISFDADDELSTYGHVFIVVGVDDQFMYCVENPLFVRDCEFLIRELANGIMIIDLKGMHPAFELGAEILSIDADWERLDDAGPHQLMNDFFDLCSSHHDNAGNHTHSQGVNDLVGMFTRGFSFGDTRGHETIGFNRDSLFNRTLRVTWDFWRAREIFLRSSVECTKSMGAPNYQKIVKGVELASRTSLLWKRLQTELMKLQSREDGQITENLDDILDGIRLLERQWQAYICN